MSLMNDLGRLLKKKEVAAFLGVTPRTVERKISRRELVVVKVGRCTRVPESVLNQYVQRNMISRSERP